MEKTILDRYTLHMMILESYMMEHRGKFHVSMRENDMPERPFPKACMSESPTRENAIPIAPCRDGPRQRQPHSQRMLGGCWMANAVGPIPLDTF